MKKPVSRNSNKNSVKSINKTAGEVRIIGGQFKRRSIRFIDADGLRPTPDRLRETLFNWLAADIHSARTLDSCAGSGVLGFEALSRGAAHCTFIEMNRAQSEMLKQSAEQLRLDANHYQIITDAAEKALSQNHIFDKSFNIVFIDPPYADKLWQPILTVLIEQQLVDRNTIIYLEANKDLTEQLAELTAILKQNSITANFQGFDCLKQTQVGQVVAGLYQLASS